MTFKDIIRKRSDDEQRIIVPVVNIQEKETEIVLNAEMPALDKSNISVEVHGDELVITGKRFNETPKGYNTIVQERPSVEYKRVFTLGNQINKDSVKAEYTDGILRVCLQKIESAQPKKIAIA